MGDAIGQMLASAVGVAISPLPLIAVVLMLATPRGHTNGTAFTVGWALALAVVAIAVVAAGSGADARTGATPATWVEMVKLVVGVLFVLLAGKQWRGRPHPGDEAETPGWMRQIDAFSPAKAAGLAVLLSAGNPKNLVLTVGAAVAIASSSAGIAGKTVAVALFVVIASLCTLVPLSVYTIGGEKATHILDSWKVWMAAHNAAIMTTLLFVLGVKYVGDALTGLTT